jgi:hypothetical protein
MGRRRPAAESSAARADFSQAHPGVELLSAGEQVACALEQPRPAQAAGRQEPVLAPAPNIDRYPTVIGGNLTLAYVTQAMRLCTQGFRYQFVDVLNELLENDPGTRGVLRQRLLPVAGATITVHAPRLREGAPESEVDLAEKIRHCVERQICDLPAVTQAIGALSWGAVYGLAGAEIDWTRRPGEEDEYRVKALRFVHSRRLNYTRQDSSDVHVWDQGVVGAGYGYGAAGPGAAGFGATSGPYGLRCADFPGKFVLHDPQLNGDYPWRGGEGRYVAAYMLLKRMTVRAAGQNFERTIRPWAIGKFKRDAQGKNQISVATKEDVRQLDALVQAIGNGSLNTGTISDACDVEIVHAAAEYTLEKWLSFLDDSIAKAMLGQTYTTAPGARGNHAVAEVAKDCMEDIIRYDARCLADTIERDLVYWIVRLNWPGCEDRYCPKVLLNTDEETTPRELMSLALDATKIDVPVDVKDLAQRAGLRVVDVGAEDYDPREFPRTRLVSTNGQAGPVQPGLAEDPNAGGEDGAGGDLADAAGAEPGEEDDSSKEPSPKKPPTKLSTKAGKAAPKTLSTKKPPSKE